MKRSEIAQVIAVLANLGVLGGLIFVGLQIRQDREIAQVERRLSTSDSRKQWANLVAANADVWAKGLSGEPLSPAESAAFNALATAWQFDVFQEWLNSRSITMEVDREVAPDLTQSFIREAALEIYSNPGLNKWVMELHERLKQVGRYGLFNELIESEIARLQNENDSAGQR